MNSITAAPIRAASAINFSGFHSVGYLCQEARWSSFCMYLSAAELAKLLPNSSSATTPGDHNHASATPEFSKEIINFLRRNNH